MNPTFDTTVILFFNKPAMTLRCLASVTRALERASDATQRIILVDNGSAEESSRRIVDGSRGAGIVRVVRLGRNAGFAAGMNAGLRAAFADPRCARVTALSNDVEVAPDYYEQLACRPVEASAGALLCPEVYYLSDRQKPAYTHGRLEVAPGRDWTLSHHYRASEAAPEIRFPDYYPAAAVVWGLEAFARTGGFDERYFCYWEDVELSHRCARLGVPLRRAEYLRVHHLGRGTTKGRSDTARRFRAGMELTMDIVGKSV